MLDWKVTKLPLYSDMGLRERDGLPILLVNGHGDVLPFLNEEISDVRSMAAPTLVIPIDGVSVPDDFFPGLNEQFSIGTDDDLAFGCLLVERQGRCGLAFSRQFSPSDYFRRRLGVSKGKVLSETTLLDYGTFGFLLFRLEESVYFLDFSPDIALRPTAQDIVLEKRRVVPA